MAEETPPKRTRAFVHISEGETSHYRSADHAMSVQRTREQVLKRAWAEFLAWEQRYRHLAEFAAVFQAARNVVGNLPRPPQDGAPEETPEG